MKQFLIFSLALALCSGSVHAASFAIKRSDGSIIYVGPSTGISAISDAGAVTLGPALTVTTANEATDTTCFPLFVTAATGDLAPKTNANLAFNSSTGAFVFGGSVSAGSFSTAGTSTITGTLDGSSMSGTVTLHPDNPGALNNLTIGQTVPLAGGFTTLTTSSTGNIIGTLTLGNGGASTAILASNLSGATDPTITFGNALITLSNGLTVTGVTAINGAGAASTPSLNVSGVPFAGTGTTSFPLVYINDANATASTTLNTAGTYLGVNGDGTQDLMNLLKDGTTQFKVGSTGIATVATRMIVTGDGTNSAPAIGMSGGRGFFSINNGFGYADGSNNTIYSFGSVANGMRLALGMPLGWSTSATDAANNALDTAFSRIVAGVIGIGTGAAASRAGWMQWNGQARVSTQFDKTDDTLADVTGLVVALKSGRTYCFRAQLDVTLDVTDGGKYAVTCASVTSLNYRVRHLAASLAVVSSARQTASASAINATATLTDDDVVIEGKITPSADANLSIQFAQVSNGSGTSSVLVGSSLLVWDMP